jgi:hypothetical protein
MIYQFLMFMQKVPDWNFGTFFVSVPMFFKNFEAQNYF